MKNLFAVVMLGGLAIFGFIAFKTPFSFCDTPRTYKLGSIDPRFNLKESTALEDINRAAGILDLGYGKKLFAYMPGTSEITINFTYDERSLLDSNINKQQSQLSKADSSLQNKIKTFENDVNVFEQKVANLNAKIQKYNNQGGAPPDVYDEIIAEQGKLKSEGDELNSRAKQLNLETHDFNSSVSNLNQDVSTFNRALQVKPEEGLYDGETKTITIYFVNTKKELIHTLTHEFGHAIGMNHVASPKAIMYPETSENIELTGEDRMELNRVCQSIPLPEYWFYELRNEIFVFEKSLNIYLQNNKFLS